MSKERWKNNPNLSSGVWRQVSKKIEKSNGIRISTKNSLVLHDGNDISMMNKNLRETIKINTINFKKND
jgi:hypothetical protein